MDASMLQSFVQVQHPSLPESPSEELYRPLTAPARAVPRTYPGAPQRESFDYHRISNMSPPVSGATTPREEMDIEMSRPSSPGATPSVEVEVVPTVWEPYMNRYRLMAAFLASVGNALSDSAAGALIPYMEKYYDIGYAVVSLIFVGQAIGFLLSAVALDPLRARLGRAKTLGLAQGMVTLAYVAHVSGAPFPVVVCAFSLVGFSIGVNVAIGNLFCGGMRNGTLMLGLMHGTYGLGGTVGPLVATAVVTSGAGAGAGDAAWTRYYLLTLGIGACTVVLGTWSFWNYEREMSPSARARESAPAATASSSSQSTAMLSVLQLRVVLLGAIFIFCYQGAEVSISGWVTSFLIHTRDGDPSRVGYVSSGFWAGITLGRFLLSGPAQRFGERRFVYLLTAGALCFQLLVWLVPNIVGEAVAVSFVGLLLGPIYPCAAAVFMRCMTRQEALSGIATISACGSLGGAVAPFVTGLLAQAVGTWVLHPIVIFLFVAMLGCWYCIPIEQKRTE